MNAVSPGTIDTPFHAQIKSTKPEVFASWNFNAYDAPVHISLISHRVFIAFDIIYKRVIDDNAYLKSVHSAKFLFHVPFLKQGYAVFAPHRACLILVCVISRITQSHFTSCPKLISTCYYQ